MVGVNPEPSRIVQDTRLRGDDMMISGAELNVTEADPNKVSPRSPTDK